MTLDHGAEMPKGTKSESRLVADRRKLLTIEAREPDKPGTPPIKNTVELENLS